jgi:hypothetical protein
MLKRRGCSRGDCRQMSTIFVNWSTLSLRTAPSLDRSFQFTSKSLVVSRTAIELYPRKPKHDVNAQLFKITLLPEAGSRRSLKRRYLDPVLSVVFPGSLLLQRRALPSRVPSLWAGVPSVHALHFAHQKIRR